MKQVLKFLMLLCIIICLAKGCRPKTNNNVDNINRKKELLSNYRLNQSLKQQEITKSDANLIINKKEDNTFDVYKKDSTFVGNFELFTRWQDGGDYYIGTKYKLTCFYFPKTDLIVKTNAVYYAQQHLFIKKETCWEIYSYSGQLVYKAPLDITVIKLKDNTNLIAKTNTRFTTIYTCDGKKVKTMNANQYKNFEKSFKNQSSTIINYAEVDTLLTN